MCGRPRHAASRSLALKPGARVWIVSHFPYETPPDLSHNCAVTLIRSARPGPDFHHVVNDAEKREWTLLVGQITAGSEYELDPGRWFPEWHPRALGYLEDLLAKEAVLSVVPGIEHYHAATLEQIRDKLRRYGREPKH